VVHCDDGAVKVLFKDTTVKIWIKGEVDLHDVVRDEWLAIRDCWRRAAS
jgi:hypothetical protein